MKHLFFLFLFFSFFEINAQKNPYPTNYFGLPVDIPLLLSGNFGELRPNHFHAGIDIKTNGVEGLPIYSVADGKVVRIKISTGGYGKVMYIEHPNGYTSVYAHLQKFSPSIEAFVKKHQYQKQKFEIEIFPKNDELPVKKGELIAKGGNTGGSAAPHLHFEIRDTKTQKTINPLLFGYKVEDNIPPQVFRLFAYSLDTSSQVEGKQLPQEIKLKKQVDGSFVTDTIFASGNIGFGVQVLDKKDNTYHTYGLYKANTFINNRPKMSLVFDEMEFVNDKYINTLIDYQHYYKTAQRVQLLYKQASNKMPFYFTDNDGTLDLFPDEKYSYFVSLEDFNGNKTEITIPIQEKKVPITTPFPEKKGELFVANKEFSVKRGRFHLFFPENTFYNDLFLDIQEGSDSIRIYPKDIPLQRSYTISIDNQNQFSENELNKVFIASVNPTTKKLSYVGASRKNQIFTAHTKGLGTFTLGKDTQAPSVTPVNFSPKYNKIQKLTHLKLKISDDITGIGSYNAYINGKWILMEYEPKENLLFFDISDIKPITETDLHFKISVKDKVNNEKILEFPLKYE